MRDVAVSHDMIVRAEDGRIPIAGGAVDGHIFPKGVVVADFHTRNSAFPFQVLGFHADAGKRKNLVALTETRVPLNDDMRVKAAFGTKDYMLANDAIGADFAVGSNLCVRMDDGGRVNQFTAFGIHSRVLNNS